MPEPTNTASAPSCITSAASAGVAMPPAEKFGTGSLPCSATYSTSSQRRLQLLGFGHQLFLAEHRELLHLFLDGAHVPHGFDDVARAGFALGADHGRAFGDAPQRFAQIARAAHERHLEVALVDVVLFVGGREHFALVDVVDAQRFENARFHEVADARLGHHRNADGLHDLADLADRRHARHAAFFADVGRARAPAPSRRVAPAFSAITRLLGVGDVHDDAALQHLGQADFHAKCVVQIHIDSPSFQTMAGAGSQFLAELAHPFQLR